MKQGALFSSHWFVFTTHAAAICRHIGWNTSMLDLGHQWRSASCAGGSPHLSYNPRGMIPTIPSAFNRFSTAPPPSILATVDAAFRKQLESATPGNDSSARMCKATPREHILADEQGTSA
jgi:hypothetical protein